MQLTLGRIRFFQQKIRSFFKEHGRILPWRQTSDPYKILVSEIMLQQTQTDRVISKYQAFIKVFPDFKALVNATNQQVLSLWSGLGYNRRALLLKRCAEVVVLNYNAKLPQSENQLRTLPGVGPYTAGAIMAFAFNKPTVMIETNIRTVFLHEFFQDKTGVNDREIIPLIKQALDERNARVWYWALMDYGAYLKKLVTNPNRRSKHYTKQSKFVGSNRQIRGQILKLLLQEKQLDKRQLADLLQKDEDLVEKILEQMVKEGFIVGRSQKFVIRS
ncbi:A/G-specific adenine glycosylase [Candidatus Microgenomates bacterium]|nr:MAG: A/G-specific adenine glycosylase [Candidatus Microgenomates bacterium]